MRKNNQKRITFVFILLIISTGFLLINDKKVCGQDPFFTLVALATNNDLTNAYLDIIKGQLAEIGINLDIILLDCGNLTDWILKHYPYDLLIYPFSDFSLETFLSEVYSENGIWNLSGYNSTIDYDTELSIGKNEWMINEINSEIPPNSIERYEKCWEWQYYLLDEILPCYPLFTYEDYMFYWDNLKGFDYQKGLLQSWGNLSWEGLHPNQINANEIVIADESWANLNPINFSNYLESPDRFIANFILEP
ncbi:MAG: hypothetical protein FK730_02785, partial [Asgard group archaeon]|nr:hypothetical protein [Asgard group archaeon]